MAKKETYEARTEALITPILDELGFLLVDVEFVREGEAHFLRAYIDKEGGITLNDCEAVARRMNDLLDEENFVEGSYIFEVSSPGLDRPLKKENDFRRCMGREVEIKTYRAIDGEKMFRGTLSGYEDGTVIILTEQEEEKRFALSEIALAKQTLDF